MLFATSAHAGAYELGAAKGLMIAGILHEKCTGKAPLPNETERQYRALLMQGFSDQDIKRGFAEGIIYAEGTYPRGTRPPKSECKEAVAMYRQTLKLIQ
ncbi:MAG TPA: hypothetical protein VJ673_13615 [Aromatoleum sp.]|uniref:hypothetical protein n=1 Tax=Aromatoleum sp. TaxID=2307007 RepID=UPI002B49682C|nr:hypothetical protein [Aromatoleum sp.]HJV26720.1 hypothetical protein [Aromatoleum sp.]